MASSVSYWQAYFHAHAQIFAYEEEHGRLSDSAFKNMYERLLKEQLRQTP
jgi:hypothetical protein